VKVITAELAEELAAAYTDHAVYPGEVDVDGDGSRFPGWTTPVLVLATENQNACTWGVPLDGTDDPPVLVGIHDGYRTETVEHAPDVDAYVAARRWDRRCMSTVPLLQAQAEPVDAKSLAFLREHYDELPATHGWPADDLYRFERDGVRILLWAGADQCDWWISGGDGLADAVTALLPYSNLREALWSNDEPGVELVDRLTG
jgi:hypothetical protein